MNEEAEGQSKREHAEEADTSALSTQPTEPQLPPTKDLQKDPVTISTADEQTSVSPKAPAKSTTSLSKSKLANLIQRAQAKSKIPNFCS